jgi:hypothetical protein
MMSHPLILRASQAGAHCGNWKFRFNMIKIYRPPKWLISDMAIHLGITSQSLTTLLRSDDAPQPIGKVAKGTNRHLYLEYNPKEVFKWYKNKNQ